MTIYNTDSMAVQSKFHPQQKQGQRNYESPTKPSNERLGVPTLNNISSSAVSRNSNQVRIYSVGGTIAEKQNALFSGQRKNGTMMNIVKNGKNTSVQQYMNASSADRPGSRVDGGVGGGVQDRILKLEGKSVVQARRAQFEAKDNETRDDDNNNNQRSRTARNINKRMDVEDGKRNPIVAAGNVSRRVNKFHNNMGGEMKSKDTTSGRT